MSRPPTLLRVALAALALLLAGSAAAAVIPVLALDLQGMVVNHYLDWTTDYAQAWYARADWVGPMQAAVWIGLSVWMGWGAVAIAWRIGDPVIPGIDPTPGLSPGRRWGTGLAVLGAVSVAVPPLALALSTQVALEVYPWIEWYGHADPIMEAIHGIGPPVLMVVLGGFALVSVGWSLAPVGSVLRRPLWIRSLRSLPRAGALGALGLLAMVVATVSVTRAVRAGGTGDGRTVHREQCGACHEAALPLYFVKTPTEWAETVHTHRAIEKLPLGDADAQALEEFLGGMRAYDDAWTFRTRCQNCHGSSWRHWEARPAQDWEALVARLARWSPYYYNGDVRTQVVRHVAAAKTDEAATLGLESEDYDRLVAVGRDCEHCHSIGYEVERYAKGTRAEARDMVARMSQKMADPYRPGRIDRVTDDWLRLARDPELLARLFPHDDPDDSGGGL